MATTLGKLGVWAFIDTMTAPEAAKFAQQLEQWGYSALWIPEAVGIADLPGFPMTWWAQLCSPWRWDRIKSPARARTSS